MTDSMDRVWRRVAIRVTDRVAPVGVRLGARLGDPVGFLVRHPLGFSVWLTLDD